jgi:hypothetical protein
MQKEENERLAELEAVIESSFVAQGNALREIRDSRLYRETHDTFEAYCQERWDYSRPQAYRLIAAAETVEVVSPNGDTASPANEAVARELKGTDEEKAAAWEEAVQKHGDKPTAKQVREVVQSRQRREQIFTQWMDVAGSTAKARLLVLKATKTVVETDWPEGPARPEIDASYMEMLQTVLKELKDSVALLDTALGGKPDVDWDAEFAKLAEAEDA